MISSTAPAKIPKLLSRPRIQSAVAKILIEENILKICEPVALVADDYTLIIYSQAEKNLPSGSIYDTIIAQAAIKAEVDQCVTLNLANFERVWTGKKGILHDAT